MTITKGDYKTTDSNVLWERQSEAGIEILSLHLLDQMGDESVELYYNVETQENIEMQDLIAQGFNKIQQSDWIGLLERSEIERRREYTKSVRASFPTRPRYSAENGSSIAWQRSMAVDPDRSTSSLPEAPPLRA